MDIQLSGSNPDGLIARKTHSRVYVRLTGPPSPGGRPGERKVHVHRPRGEQDCRVAESAGPGAATLGRNAAKLLSGPSGSYPSPARADQPEHSLYCRAVSSRVLNSEVSRLIGPTAGIAGWVQSGPLG